jgi:hypothetical protein
MDEEEQTSPDPSPSPSSSSGPSSEPGSEPSPEPSPDQPSSEPSPDSSPEPSSSPSDSPSAEPSPEPSSTEVSSGSDQVDVSGLLDIETFLAFQDEVNVYLTGIIICLCAISFLLAEIFAKSLRR